MAWKPWHSKPKVTEPCIKVVYTGNDANSDLITHYVYRADEYYYHCYSEWNRIDYTINKKLAYTDKEELKWMRWVIRVHGRTTAKRHKFLSTTKMSAYKQRYIKEYPEKLI